MEMRAMTPMTAPMIAPTGVDEEPESNMMEVDVDEAEDEAVEDVVCVAGASATLK